MSARQLTLSLQKGPGTQPQQVGVAHLVVAGWTGRDASAVEKHMAELEAIGIARPASAPIFYRVATARLTTNATIEDAGKTSGGEVEYLILWYEGRYWVGLGSDHTDREVEKYGVTVSKQMCDKPIAPQFWPYDEVAPHWDRLILRSFVIENGTRRKYQEGSVAAMLDPMDLVARYTGNGSLADQTLMFCGTLAAHGGVRPTQNFAFEIEDPVLGRKIAHEYQVTPLPVLG
jgi:hypothetical protein